MLDKDYRLTCVVGNILVVIEALAYIELEGREGRKPLKITSFNSSP